MQKELQTECWCGSTGLSPFSPDYFQCDSCFTLVRKQMPSPADLTVSDDERDFYGRNYYERHLVENRGLPALADRERTDLFDRVPQWFRVFTTYRLPPARVLELGSAHGAFVAFLRSSGFDATGLELSPWLAQRARNVFGVPTLTGPIETQRIEPASLDAVVMMDVLEHLRDPMGTLRACARLLKPDGFFMIQTPEFKPGLRFEDLTATRAPFLSMLIDEHLYLTSRRAAADMFRRVGFSFLAFQEPVFAYDMLFVASRVAPETHAPREVASSLMASPSGRIVLSVLDAQSALSDYRDHLLPETRAAAEARLMAIHQLTGRISVLDRQIQDLAATLQAGHGRITELERAAAERLEALRTADKDLFAVRTRVAELEHAAAERLNALITADGALRAANNRVAEFEHAAEERLQALRVADDALQAAYGRIRELERAQADRCDVIEHQQSQLEEASTRIATLVGALANLRSDYYHLEQERLALMNESLIGFLRRRYVRQGSSAK